MHDGINHFATRPQRLLVSTWNSARLAMLAAHSAAFTGQPLSGVVVRTSPARSRMRRTCRARPREVVTCSSRPLLSPNAALTTGAALLTTVLTNRLLFTSIDDLYPPQSRSDIIAVIASATLVLYGLGRAEVAERRAAVDMGGVDVVPASDSAFRALPDSARAELEWSADAVLDAMPTFKSVAVVVGDATVFRRGRFRAPDSVPVVPAGGIADNVRKSAERAYLADLKVVPVKEVEFAFFPENCQVRCCVRLSRELLHSVDRCSLSYSPLTIDFGSRVHGLSHGHRDIGGYLAVYSDSARGRRHALHSRR